jgi:SSS family transporter
MIMLVLTISVTYLGHKLSGTIRSRNSFFNASGSMPWWAVSASIVATVVSSVTFISVPAAVFKDGGNITYIQIILGLMLGKIVTASMFARPYYESIGIKTTYDYIGERMDNYVKYISMGVGLLLTTLNAAIKLLTTALVLSVITSWSLSICTGVIVLFSILWSWLAGLKTVIWTDFILFIIFSIGAIFAMFWSFLGLDLSSAQIWSMLDQNAKLVLFDFSTDPQTTYTIWAGICGSITLSLALTTSQGTMQRIRACRSVSDAKKAYNYAALFYFVHFCIVGVGLALWVHYQVTPLPTEVETQLLTEPDRIFPYFIMTEIPEGISGIFIAAIFAAGISTLDSVITEVADISVNNVYEPFINPNASEKHYLLVSKLSLFAWGVIFYFITMFLSKYQAEGLLNLTFKLPSYLFGMLFGTAILARYKIGSIKSYIPGFIVACCSVWLMTFYSIGFFWWCPISGLLMIVTTVAIEKLRGEFDPEMSGIVLTNDNANQIKS